MLLKELNTPCYIIRAGAFEENMARFRAAFASRWGERLLLGYSVKTNNFPWLLKTAMARGFWAEVVSPDEYAFALRCGCPEEKILFNGPQKQERLLSACRAGATVNLDNLEEVDAVCAAFGGGDFAPRLGLRVNFDLEALCPGETTCRGVPGRFGLCLENGDFARALEKLQKAGLPLAGLHLHQSSKTRSLNIFGAIAKTAAEIAETYDLRELDYVDLGGGFFGGSFFPGKPSFDEYAQTVCSILKRGFDPEKTTLVLEPGAAILATAMDYLCSVLNIREVRGQRIVTLDGSLLHINPMMNPHPTPFTMLHPGAEGGEDQIVAGSTCMELDRFWPRDMHNLAEHDTQFLFHACGAYMSTHNSSFINAAPNIYLERGGDYTLLRKKSLDALFRVE